MPPIIEPGALQGRIVRGEAQGTNEVQFAGRAHAKARDISGIWRDLRLIEDHVHHREELATIGH